MKHARKYLYVTGGKGGVGKSTLSQALVDYVSATKRTVLLIDADPTNPDSSACFKPGKDKNVRTQRIRIRSEDATGQSDNSGLIETLNSAQSDDCDVVIVDAPAGDTALISETGSLITDACRQMSVMSIFIIVLDSNDRTAANALSAIWSSILNADLVLFVKNDRKGSNFEFLENSKIFKLVEKTSNVKIIHFPKMASRIESHLRIDRMTWSEVASVTPIGNRVEAARLREIFHRNFASVDI